MTTPVDPLIGYFNQAHQNSDVNEDVDSLHHTLGPGPQQAAPGNHTHGDGIIGSLIMFAGLATPAKYILCDGSAVDRVTFAALFATIGTLYGVGNGTTTFNLPNFTNAFPRGNFIATGGADSHQHSSVDVGTPTGSIIDSAHSHSISGGTTSDSGHIHSFNTGTTALGQQANTTATGASLRLTSPDPHSHSGNTTGPTAAHTHTIANTDASADTSSFVGNDMGLHQHDIQNNVPKYTGVKFLIRYAA